MGIPLISYNQINKNKGIQKKRRNMFLPYFSSVIFPSLYRSYLLRNAELSEKEKRLRLFFAFSYGFFISTYLSLLTNTYFSNKILINLLKKEICLPKSIEKSNFICSVIIAPIFEEIYKGMVIFVPCIYNQLNEIEDGLIFGAEIGNGFATLENIFYGKMMNNTYMSTLIIIIRQFTSSALHTCTTAYVGEGIAKFRIYCNNDYSFHNINKNLPVIIKYLLKAILLHAIHNYSCIKIKSSKSIIYQIINYCYKIYNLKIKIENYDNLS
jgi:RsiW-degrading membrane proteinase PrsW (M82 family)